MSPSAREYLQHILDETAYLIASSRDLSQDNFVGDETLKRAYVRSIEVIGEAVKQLPASLRQKYATIALACFGRNTRSINSPLFWCGL